MNFIEHQYEELFNTKLDPHETKNLANDAAYASELDKLKARYAELKEAVK